jgi:type IX secretion system PorP/SprF family membrane protein
MKKITILLVASLLVKFSIAQDPFFSQFSASPMTLNPALVGSNMPSLNRASFISRSQFWGGQSFATNMLGFERNITASQQKDNQMNLGLMMLNERSNGGMLSNSYFNATVQDNVRLTENGVVKGGISLAYVNKLIDLSGATFGTQYGAFGSSSTSYDPVGGSSIKYMDLNLGVAYEHTTDQLNFELGAAMFHAARPKESFIKSSNYRINTRNVAHAAVTWKPSAAYELLFAGNVQFVGSKKYTTFGGAFTYHLHDELANKLTIGIWNRVGEFVSPYVALQVKDAKFGLSYDVASNKIKTSSNSLSSVEASVVWSFGNTKK